ncbi:MAG: hypothetical protein ABIR70_15420 [Bryobacteraceae bacterium]
MLAEHGLEAILIGNAAAALQGAPVTTVDLDFLIRKTPRNLQKLTAVAKTLGAMVLRPHYPVSGLFRLMRDDDGLQLDFMTVIHGVRSFESLRSRSQTWDFAGHALLVEAFVVARSTQRSAGGPVKPKLVPRKQQLDALRAESDRALIEAIRRLLDKPMEERTHFLRKRIGLRASAI